MTENKVLDLGCGARKTPGAVGLDQIKLDGVDIVHDLDTYPYPVADNSFDRIVLRHAAEHVADVMRLMEEVHRIGKAGGTVEIHVPHFSSANAYADPTHRHYFSMMVFDFFCGATAHGYLVRYNYRLKRRRAEFWPVHDRLPWLTYRLLGLGWMAERHTVFYERFLTFLFPLREFTVELEIIK